MFPVRILTQPAPFAPARKMAVLPEPDVFVRFELQDHTKPAGGLLTVKVAEEPEQREEGPEILGTTELTAA
jgi:hypothetical protein